MQFSGSLDFQISPLRAICCVPRLWGPIRNGRRRGGRSDLCFLKWRHKKANRSTASHQLCFSAFPCLPASLLWSSFPHRNAVMDIFTSCKATFEVQTRTSLLPQLRLACGLIAFPPTDYCLIHSNPHEPCWQKSSETLELDRDCGLWGLHTP